MKFHSSNFKDEYENGNRFFFFMKKIEMKRKKKRNEREKMEREVGRKVV